MFAAPSMPNLKASGDFGGTGGYHICQMRLMRAIILRSSVESEILGFYSNELLFVRGWRTHADFRYDFMVTADVNFGSEAGPEL